jgi:hypothetical protein
VSRIDATLKRPKPPAYGTAIVQPKAPSPRPKPVPPPPWTGLKNKPLAAIVLNGGKTKAAPNDGVVRKTPPKPPKQVTSPSR